MYTVYIDTYVRTGMYVCTEQAMNNAHPTIHTPKYFSYTRLLDAALPPHITPRFILTLTHSQATFGRHSPREVGTWPLPCLYTQCGWRAARWGATSQSRSWHACLSVWVYYSESKVMVAMVTWTHIWNHITSHHITRSHGPYHTASHHHTTKYTSNRLTWLLSHTSPHLHLAIIAQ